MLSPKENKIWSYSSEFTEFTVKLGNKKKPGKIFLTLFLVSLMGGIIVGTYATNNYNQLSTTTHTMGFNGNYLDGYGTISGASLDDYGTEPDLVISQGGWIGPFDTEAGYIDIYASNVQLDALPLCITNEFLSSWEVVVEVYGGYEPVETFIPIYQKGVHVGTIWTTWTEITGDIKPEGTCCAFSYWLVTFQVEEPICLDSNQYPPVCDGFGVYAFTEHPDNCVPIPYETIPGKEVMGYVHSVWTGCHQLDQRFVIISLDKTAVP